MCSLSSQLDALNLGEERNVLFGYVWRTKQTQKFFVCKNNFVVIPDVESSKLVLCRKYLKENEACYVCLQCTGLSVIENLGNVKNLIDMKKDYCNHAKLCTVLFAKQECNEIPEENEVEISKDEKEFIALVHPAKDMKSCLVLLC